MNFQVGKNYFSIYWFISRNQTLRILKKKKQKSLVINEQKKSEANRDIVRARER